MLEHLHVIPGAHEEVTKGAYDLSANRLIIAVGVSAPENNARTRKS